MRGKGVGGIEMNDTMYHIVFVINCYTTAPKYTGFKGQFVISLNSISCLS